MSFTNKSIILVLLLFIGHTNGVTGRSLPFDNGHVLNTIPGSIDETELGYIKHVSQTNSEQTPSLSQFYLILLVIVCILFVYTLFRVDKLTKRLRDLDPVLVAQKRNLRDTTYVSVKTEQVPVTITARDIKWLEKLDELIKNELSNALLKPIDLAEHMGVCERQLQRKLKELKGISPAKYLKQKRLKMGYEYLQSGDFQTVSEVAYKVGYHSPNNFSRAFKIFFGKKPNDLLNTMIMV